MATTARVRTASLALLAGLMLGAAIVRPLSAIQDAGSRDAREPAFVRMGDDGRIVVKQDGREREYALIGVEWPAAEVHRQEARAYLKRLLAGEALKIEPREQKFATTKPSKDDATAPTPAYIRRGPEGLLVNSEVIRLGYAKVAAKPAFEQLSAFREVEKRARDAGKGVWADDAPAQKSDREVRDDREKPENDDGRGARPPKPPADGVVVYITPSGEKYHLKTCQFAKNAQPVSIAEAIQKGKTPCSRCKPPARP